MKAKAPSHRKQKEKNKMEVRRAGKVNKKKKN